MYMETLSSTEARTRFLRLVDEIERNPGKVVEVTKRGRRVAALLSAERYEALLETLEILGDAEAMRSLRRSRKQAASGKKVPWATARARLGLA